LTVDQRLQQAGQGNAIVSLPRRPAASSFSAFQRDITVQLLDALKRDRQFTNLSQVDSGIRFMSKSIRE
jgi:hypothetical protein